MTDPTKEKDFESELMNILYSHGMPEHAIQDSVNQIKKHVAVEVEKALEEISKLLDEIVPDAERKLGVSPIIHSNPKELYSQAQRVIKGKVKEKIYYLKKHQPDI